MELKTNALVAYLVYLVILNFIKEFWRRIVDRSHTIDRLQAVYIPEISNGQKRDVLCW